MERVASVQKAYFLKIFINSYLSRSQKILDSCTEKKKLQLSKYDKKVKTTRVDEKMGRRSEEYLRHERSRSREIRKRRRSRSRESKTRRQSRTYEARPHHRSESRGRHKRYRSRSQEARRYRSSRR
ncbi:unnamed protein product [Thelazia callipaeda]|uniref:Female-specific protein transformer n=1 Tax=Thelazia callipaeda TaxID=103827 RepID=A0A0N5CMX4_THECL|nr:unnamed protein product [Thelazia callipaeda]